MLPAQLRLQEKLGHIKGRLLRDSNAMVKKCKISGSGVVVTLLDTDGEKQPMFTMNLRVRDEVWIDFGQLPFTLDGCRLRAGIQACRPFRSLSGLSSLMDLTPA